MEHTFIPALFEAYATKDQSGADIPAPYSGTVTLRMPSFDERVAFYDDAGVEMYETDLAPDQKKARSRKLVRHVARKIDQHFVRSDIVRTRDGFQINTLEMLRHDTDMIMVMMEMANKLVGTFNVGAVGNGGSTSSPSTSPPSTASTPDPGAPPTS